VIIIYDTHAVLIDFLRGE